MKRYITIDGGTTNTRLTLVENEKIPKTLKINIGAKDCINDNSPLKNAIKETLKNLLEEFSLAEKDIKNAVVRVIDRGALECVIRARVETAVLRGKGDN